MSEQESLLLMAQELHMVAMCSSDCYDDAAKAHRRLKDRLKHWSAGSRRASVYDECVRLLVEVALDEYERALAERPQIAR